MSAATHTSHVLVVDDDADFRAVVREVLERSGFVVREALDGEHALEEARVSKPSLVILDVGLPGISGYEVLRALQDTVDADLPVVFVTGQGLDRSDRVRALLLGADDCFSKPFEPDELLARIRRSLAGRGNGGTPHISTEIAPPLASLTPRELEILALLADGLSQAQIAARLVVSTRTVGKHIQNVLTKLDVHSRAHAVALALRSGLDSRRRTAHDDTEQSVATGS